MGGGDALVALGKATIEGETLFAHNCHVPAGQCLVRKLVPGRSHAPGETTPTQHLEIAQARQTHRVLAAQPHGVWGYAQGVNEHRLAVACTRLESKLCSTRPGLVGTDLVRLTLERAHSAAQAVDVIADLLSRHGHGRFARGMTSAEQDCALLLADAHEAFLVETAGPYWVYQQVLQVRASSDVPTIRQDWDRIAPGLAARAIEQSWWPGDGNKLDFAGAACDDPVGTASALRRWGRATVLLEEQSGHIDVAFLRRLMTDHYEGMHCEVDPQAETTAPVPLCRHVPVGGDGPTCGSLVTSLNDDAAQVQVVWSAFGPPCAGVYFPLLLEGELPRPFSRGGAEPSEASLGWRAWLLHEQLRSDTARWTAARESFSRLQARFDQETAEFVAEAATLRRLGSETELQRFATLFMQHNLERFDAAMETITGRPRNVAVEETADPRADALPATPVEFFM